ncbi:DUF4824 family protein [Cellvibrio japonicus]|uniref:DUF4824 family protein n=1 Tax=Cellvibrio japonicus (strain Ueda107) TaxID=498211 RepID=B3PGV0_CELJU|nr:DUF4824 family protein [Cellvibrio japonicus]ACE83622.1 hypothetical protein CJA_3545 [Cellvibrio japonicus Ueda107]QEI13761.1 DUF4824 family protein [Cellvibrio japonicus]QEI17335.1 DUF4824 family protein [Cellvibrio japonicus]QEI20912.1 DUF4824 family protein [Cellvibrio japonicus]
MKKLTIISIGFLLTTNILLLGKVWYNRWEPHYGALTLSERELRLPSGYRFNKENSGISLDLTWNTKDDDTPNRLWGYNRELTLSDEHFSSFGFAACNNQYRERAQPGWILVEFNGPAYRNYLASMTARRDQHIAAEPTDETLQKTWQQEKDTLDKRVRQVAQEESRLFVIDAAANSAVLIKNQVSLQAKNTQTQYLTLPAKIRSSYRRCLDNNAKPTSIQIDSLLIARIHVPNRLARQLPNTSNNNSVRYQATLRYGRLLEPWVRELQILPP